MVLRKIVASGVLALAFSSLLSGCDREKEDTYADLKKNVATCLKKSDINIVNLGILFPFAGENPTFIERDLNSRHQRLYDLERRTVTRTTYNGTPMGTLTYDQLPESERVRMNLIEQCYSQATMPTLEQN